MTIANTILAQLGGNRFIAMTGARNLIDHGDALSLRIPTGFSEVNGQRTGINAIKISYDAGRDLYDMEFSGIRGMKITPKGAAQGVYNDQLAEIFTRYTGLDTRL